MVLLMRLSDLPRQCTNEPPLHPQCAAYTAAACPMVAGRLDYYRSSPIQVDAAMVAPPQVSARYGARAEPWFAVWLRNYRIITDYGHLAASYAGVQPLRIRPITWRLPGIW